MAEVYAVDWPGAVWDLLFTPQAVPRGRDDARARGLLAGQLGLVGLTCLAPLMIVDEASIACVVTNPIEGCTAPLGSVIRVFHGNLGSDAQFALLDMDPMSYVESIAEELAARDAGITRVLDEIGPAYQDAYGSKGKRPRDFVLRPVRIACQNVIVALAAIAQEASFDGLSVVAWQTCEVPHVAAHEANRALAALTLCDAFQNGGTMEIRFDRPVKVVVNGNIKTYEGHPEGRVPASLRRYGRTIDVALGAEDPAAISPAEARQLFLAITPMPGHLRSRVERAISSDGMLPERVCFALLSPDVWREIELDFILSTSQRSPSILAGGADWQHRGARQAEAEVCRSAVMLGMLYRRLNTHDTAVGEGAVRVIEDRSRGVTWEIDESSGCVTFLGLPHDESVPWSQGIKSSSLRVLPCSRATPEMLGALRNAAEDVTALVVPRDVHLEDLPDGIAVLRCPDRLADLDKQVEKYLLNLRISRG